MLCCAPIFTFGCSLTSSFSIRLKMSSSRSEEDMISMGSPFLAFEAILGFFTGWSKSDDESDVLAAPFMALLAVVRWFWPITSNTRSNPHYEDEPDRDVDVAPWLAFACIARSATPAVDDEPDLAPPASFAYTRVSIDEDDVLGLTTIKVLSFVLRILSFMATPFSPSREPPALVKKSPSKSNLQGDDLASLAGAKLFGGSKRRAKKAVRLRNTL